MGKYTEEEFKNFVIAMDGNMDVLSEYIKFYFGEIEYYDVLIDAFIKTPMCASILIEAFRIIYNNKRNKISCDFKSFIYDLSSELSKGFPIHVIVFRYCT